MKLIMFFPPRQKVAIDVCKIYGPDAVFLQQAAHLTGGSYIYLERRDAFLQHLLVRIITEVFTKTFLTVSRPYCLDDIPTYAIDA